ncbi:hypothetical protein GE118_03350 [Mycoplasma sp. NEAQ87857]|uniref:hypothetical protein n=1 Tax=Mycoplasma sp. NEAQ87857 TaxID=2683967 RepID=UPI00131852FC|nr:hypothetical protein [Mycoplasma sp. NEAQ87857]QGZ97825.1 hypothetical protein GE118_03350 [Mycoplasma sp. NEAQ87857]
MKIQVLQEKNGKYYYLNKENKKVYLNDAQIYNYLNYGHIKLTQDDLEVKDDKNKLQEAEDIFNSEENRRQII